MKSNLKNVFEHSNKRPWMIDASHSEDREGIQIWSNDEIVADVVPDQHGKQDYNAKLIAHCVNHFEIVVTALEAAYFQFEHNGQESDSDKKVLDYMEQIVKLARRIK